ncbi:MAG: adenylyl-sulfate kinase [Alphaproteobacteria bacterium]|nr:MAG: adenylyl-sulfate kinase [Alphaproteobacteria bacterium]TAF40820.1 MAG: adenylyl-sulfate kinase [Alphaproteobacteria bacterium]TAF77008.1 MAG: adenylyl-sulfate kinase [Alphaproteobacteria bacterium]
MNTNIITIPPQSSISYAMRTQKNKHHGGVLWFTGLSGSGKSTLAQILQKRLFDEGCQVYVLDGDHIRQGLNRDLGFSPHDRSENIRRIGEVAALFADAGIIVLCAFISPYQEDRNRARLAAGDKFHLVHVNASVELCEERDVKGLYRKARLGEIKDFTGISAPYEIPHDAEIVLDTAQHEVEYCSSVLYNYVRTHLFF